MKSDNGKQRVAIPSACYKIVARKQPDGTLTTLSILLPHTLANPDGPEALAYLQAHVTTKGAIEKLTGLTLFQDAPTLVEASTFWPFVGPQPTSLVANDAHLITASVIT